MSEDRVYLAGGEDKNGDHHLFATDNLGREPINVRACE